MINYFDNLNEKMADWFLQFFSDDEYIVQTASSGPDAVFITIEAKHTDDIFSNININLSFLNDIYLKLVQWTVVTGNILLSVVYKTKVLIDLHYTTTEAVKNIADTIKDNVTEVMTKNKRATVIRHKMTTVVENIDCRISSMSDKLVQYLRNNVFKEIRIFEQQHFAHFSLRNLFLEGHTT